MVSVPQVKGRGRLIDPSKMNQVISGARLVDQTKVRATNRLDLIDPTKVNQIADHARQVLIQRIARSIAVNVGGDVDEVSLNLLFARLVDANGSYEFAAEYDSVARDIDVKVPDDVMATITAIVRGPGLKKFMDWLVGRQELAESVAAEVIAKLSQGDGVSRSPNIGVYACPAGACTQNMAVCMDQGDDNAVLPASAVDPTLFPAVGFVNLVLQPDQVVVQYAWELTGFSALIAGKTYWLGNGNGQITLTPPTDQGNVQQKLGFARNSTTLIVDVDRDFVEM